MNTHVLKTHPQHFAKTKAGAKPFEIRKNDRDYKIGDQIRLMEYCPDKNEYTGLVHHAYIGEVSHYQQKDDFVVLGLTDRIFYADQFDD